MADLMRGEALVVAVIYDNPSDYPGRYVTRLQRIMTGGEVVIDPAPLAVEPSIRRARKAVPPELSYRMPRQPDDDPTIVEIWI